MIDPNIYYKVGFTRLLGYENNVDLLFIQAADLELASSFYHQKNRSPLSQVTNYSKNGGGK